jgi:hypothetical protein
MDGSGSPQKAHAHHAEMANMYLIKAANAKRYRQTDAVYDHAQRAIAHIDKARYHQHPNKPLLADAERAAKKHIDWATRGGTRE